MSYRQLRDWVFDERDSRASGARCAVHRGVYAVGIRVSRSRQCLAAVLACGRCAPRRRAAAWLWGLRTVPACAEAAMPRRHGTQSASIIAPAIAGRDRPARRASRHRAPRTLLDLRGDAPRRLSRARSRGRSGWTCSISPRSTHRSSQAAGLAGRTRLRKRCEIYRDPAFTRSGAELATSSTTASTKEGLPRPAIEHLHSRAARSTPTGSDERFAVEVDDLGTSPDSRRGVRAPDPVRQEDLKLGAESTRSGSPPERIEQEPTRVAKVASPTSTAHTPPRLDGADVERSCAR